MKFSRKFLAVAALTVAALTLLSPASQAGPAGLQTAKQGLAAMRASAGANLRAHFAGETGAFDFVRSVRGSVLAPAARGASARERAFAFLGEYGAGVGMSGA